MSMWWLCLDESGDLGFDFVNKKPSKFFTICILATSRRDTNQVFDRAVRRTLRHKLNPKAKRKRLVQELKGAATTLAIKSYAWRQVSGAQFGIYALTLNKRRVFPQLAAEKDRVYNFVARKVVDRIPFEKASGNVQLIVDRSKGSQEIVDFNQYMMVPQKVGMCLVTSFRRKPESREFKQLQSTWTPVFAGETTFCEIVNTSHGPSRGGSIQVLGWTSPM